MSNPENNSIAAVEPIPGMPRMEIVYKPISWFKEYGRNPRRNDAAVERMCASIREFGFAVAMLCLSTGEIVDGHLRFKGARKLGMPELPVVLCDHWTEAQVKAFRLMVSRSSLATMTAFTLPPSTMASSLAIPGRFRLLADSPLSTMTSVRRLAPVPWRGSSPPALRAKSRVPPACLWTHERGRLFSSVTC